MSSQKMKKLLDILRNKILGLDIPVEIDDELVALAQIHSLNHFLTKENALHQVKITLRQIHLLNLISDAFETADIDYMPLKGSVAKHLYPEVWMRSSGDIDILVHKKDMNKAKNVLVSSLKMELVREGSHCWEFKYGDLIAEIHYRLINNVMMPDVVKVLGDGWKYSIKEEGHKYSLTPEAFYFYHLAHMAVHIYKGGCGIRPFIDAYLIVHKMSMDCDELNRMLKIAGLTDFEKKIREISESWMSGIYSETEEEEFIVNGGIFGYFENGLAMSQAGNGGKRKTMIKRVFLPFQEMKYRYPVLEEKAWMLPICWGQYWIWVIKSGKLMEGKSILERNAKVSKSDYSRAVRIVDAFGLNR